LVQAVYSSTCGSHTEDNDAVWGDDPSPALRGRPDFDTAAHPELAAFAGNLDEVALRAFVAAPLDTYCAQAKPVRQDKLRSAKRFTAAEVDALVAGPYPGLGALRDLAIGERGHGGRVISLKLAGERGSATVLYELPIRQLFGNLSSGAFVLDVERNTAGK